MPTKRENKVMWRNKTKKKARAIREKYQRELEKKKAEKEREKDDTND